jgi:hypothetical protein
VEPADVKEISGYARSTPLLRRPARPPIERARYPIVDAHNHLFGDTTAEEMIAIMDAVGVETFINVTGNCLLPVESGGYAIRQVRRLYDVRVRPLGRFRPLLGARRREGVRRPLPPAA